MAVSRLFEIVNMDNIIVIQPCYIQRLLVKHLKEIFFPHEVGNNFFNRNRLVKSLIQTKIYDSKSTSFDLVNDLVFVIKD